MLDIFDVPTTMACTRGLTRGRPSLSLSLTPSDGFHDSGFAFRWEGEDKDSNSKDSRGRDEGEGTIRGCGNNDSHYYYGGHGRHNAKG